MKGSKAKTNSTKGESHRIYWQQWPSNAASNKSKPKVSSRRDLITSSAAIRISPVGARAQDVTHLLCETLNLKSLANKRNDNNSPRHHQESWDRVQDAWEQDSLVLVGTLYSLPMQHVRFEHERLDLMAKDDTSGTNKPSILSRNDPPFHVIRTLKGTDNPIQVRNAMIQHLESILKQSAASTTRTTSVSPKLQWYFVPGINHPSSPIPSYIDLDGYATAMEEGEVDEDEIEEEHSSKSNKNTNEEDDGDWQDSEHDIDTDELLSSLSLSLEEKNNLHDATTSTTTDATTTANDQKYPTTQKERIFKKERQLYFELSLCQSSLQQDCVSGYLLKQSMTDPHVWKRMHCVLTDDHLWYVSRIYTRLDEASTEFYSFARHRRMGLTRALLLQPTADKPTAPLFRTPFAFEVIDSNGSPHRFRASNPENYKRWVTALQARIVQAYENSLLEHAELIVRDETEARNKRFKAVTVEPLWDIQQQHANSNSSNISNHDERQRHNSMDAPTLQILRFGIEVTQYREHCRHIEAILPAKYPVLAMTDSTPELRLNGSQNGSDSGSVRSNTSSGAFRLDSKTQALIKSAWDEAVRLGSRATKLAVALQSASGSSSTKMPRSLETICQHLEYVITGNFHRNGSKPANLRQSDNTRQYPPPVDLFDQLLLELQSGASVVSAKARRDAAAKR